MASTADYIKIAEGIRSNEISSRQRIEHLSSEISDVISSINSAQNEINSLEASISAEMSTPYETDSEGNTYGGPNYAAISSMQAQISSLRGQIMELSAQRAQLEGERDTERQHLQEILIEKSATLSEVQSKAQDAAASVAAAGGMVGAYSGIGANLANSFQNAHSNLSQAAGILGGSVAGVSAGGGGGGNSGRSASGIRGVPSQTRNSAAGMTTHGTGGGGRSTSGSSKRSAAGASRGMKTNETARGSSTAGKYSTSQSSAAGTAFGFGAGTGNGAAPLNANKFSTSKTSSVPSSFSSHFDRKMPSEKNFDWVGENGQRGERGNSICTLKDGEEYYYDKKNGIKMSGKELKKMFEKKYGTSSVKYTNGEPDFTPYVDPFLGEVYSEKRIPYQRDNNKYEKGTFDFANRTAAMRWAKRDGLSDKEAAEHIDEYIKKVKNYMDENHLTWHECGDMHTILPVPSEINGIFSHTGGISFSLEFQAVKNIIRDRIGYRNIKLSRGPQNFTTSSKELNRVKQNLLTEIKTEMNRIKNFKIIKVPKSMIKDGFVSLAELKKTGGIIQNTPKKGRKKSAI